MTQSADLRVCGSCEWIFLKSEHDVACPKCQFGSYGARYVYGTQAYSYRHNQKPWLNKKLSNYNETLHREIKESQSCTKHSTQGIA